MGKHRILAVDDEGDILDAICWAFESEYEVLTAQTGRAGLDILRRETVAAMIVDQRMPEMSGADFLKRAVEIAPRAMRIMLTGYSDMEALIEAVNAGHIYRYIAKPWEPDELRMDVRRAVQSYEMAEELDRRYAEIARLNAELEEARRKLEMENLQLRHAAGQRNRFDGLVGQSLAMERTLDMVEKVLNSDVSVLLTGQTGTGKELIARCIHFNGKRKEGPFVAQNCGALPPELLESELFGHKKGSFTGATDDRPGLFEAADGGTVFLDEIGETSAAMQVRLLRVLQEGEIRRVGENAPRRVDVRVIAATNRDMREEVRAGRFREDLFFRLNVFPIALPMLRERAEDVPLLAMHFLKIYAPERRVRFHPEAIDLLCKYAWPGNIRELENEVQRALLIAGDAERIGPDALSEAVRGHSVRAGTLPGNMKAAVAALERDLICQALARCEGNRTRAAHALGISRWGLVQKIEKYGIEG